MKQTARRVMVLLVGVPAYLLCTPFVFLAPVMDGIWSGCKDAFDWVAEGPEYFKQFFVKQPRSDSDA